MQRRVQRGVQHGVQEHVRMSATHEKMFTAGEAAQGCGVSRTTISRAAAAGRIAGAERDEAGAWVLPLSGLLAAGFNPGKPSPPEDEKPRDRDDDLDRDRTHELELAVLRAEVREQRTRADGLERERDLYRLMLEQGKPSQTRPESSQTGATPEPAPTPTPGAAGPSTGDLTVREFVKMKRDRWRARRQG